MLRVLTGFVAFSDSPDSEDSISASSSQILAIFAELQNPNSISATLDLLYRIKVVKLSVTFLVEFSFLFGDNN